MGKVDLETLGLVGPTFKLETKMIKFYSKIKKIDHKNRVMRSWMEGEQHHSEIEDIRWYMLLEGSWEYLFVGMEEPKSFRIGDEVEVVIRIKS